MNAEKAARIKAQRLDIWTVYRDGEKFETTILGEKAAREIAAWGAEQFPDSMFTVKSIHGTPVPDAS